MRNKYQKTQLTQKQSYHSGHPILVSPLYTSKTQPEYLDCFQKQWCSYKECYANTSNALKNEDFWVSPSHRRTSFDSWTSSLSVVSRFINKNTDHCALCIVHEACHFKQLTSSHFRLNLRNATHIVDNRTLGWSNKVYPTANWLWHGITVYL